MLSRAWREASVPFSDSFTPLAMHIPVEAIKRRGAAISGLVK